jgi:hypothetical protein
MHHLLVAAEAAGLINATCKNWEAVVTEMPAAMWFLQLPNCYRSPLFYAPALHRLSNYCRRSTA